MDETRNMSVKVAESLHCKVRGEIEAHPQTMSQFIETVLHYYFNREDEKTVNGNKRTLAFQVSEEFFQQVQDFIRTNNMKLKDFGITAMQCMMEGTVSDSPAAPSPESGDEAEPEEEPPGQE